MTGTTTIRVRPGPRRGRYCEVAIERGLLERLPGMLAGCFNRRKIWVVTDSNVLRLYGRRFHRKLVLAGADTGLVEIPPGEASKRPEILASLQTRLLEHGIERTSIMVALGGGVVGDLAGFAAATLLRGIEYLQVPTTLLAQVDSSVGGKVGINHALGKNLIGAFHHPSAVYVDPEVLRTLPVREFRSGLAEVIKIAAALDRGLFRDLERCIRKLTRTGGIALSPRIAAAISLKAAVVARDEREAGLRKVLNLGHTLGHAVEAASGYAIRHGEGVAIGLAAEAAIAVNMGLLPRGERDRLVRLLHRAGLPTRFPRSLDRRRLLRSLSMDKKAERGTPRFVLLRRIGAPVVGVEVPSPFVLEVIEASR